MRDSFADNARFISPMFEVTGLYNRHATTEDALQTTAEIPDKSLVFIEGVADAYEGEHMLEQLNRVRTYYGAQSPKYREVKERLVEACEELLEKDEAGEFEHHQLMLGMNLMKKECVVHIADFPGYSPSADKRDVDVMQYADKYVGAPMISALERGDLREPSGAASAFKKLSYACIAALHYQDMREYAGTLRIASAMNAIGEGVFGSDPRFSRSNDGKVLTSIVYGTSHAHSLSSKLNTYLGMNVEQRILTPIAEHQYQDEKLDGEIIHRRVNFELARAMYWLNDEMTEGHPAPDMDVLFRRIDELIPRSSEGKDTSLRIVKVLQGASRGTDRWLRDMDSLLYDFDAKLAVE